MISNQWVQLYNLLQLNKMSVQPMSEITSPTTNLQKNFMLSFSSNCKEAPSALEFNSNLLNIEANAQLNPQFLIFWFKRQKTKST